MNEFCPLGLALGWELVESAHKNHPDFPVGEESLCAPALAFRVNVRRSPQETFLHRDFEDIALRV